MPRSPALLLMVVVGAVVSSASAQELPTLEYPVDPTHANVKYGDQRRQVMDVWLSESDTPTPVLVSIHGGGFRNGDRSVDEGVLRGCLQAKIAVVAITYRFTPEAIAPAQFEDAARAVQFVRHHAKEWNLDAKRMAATGSSAGAGLSLWLAFHDDMADPESDDPVARQSTRLTCATVFNGQSSYDPRFIRDLLPGTDIYKHPAVAALYDFDPEQLDSLPAEKYALFEKTSPIHHVTKDDVPVQLIYNIKRDAKVTSDSIGIHHPKFGQALKDRMEQLDIECDLRPGIRGGPRGRTKMVMEFLQRQLLESKATGDADSN